jgi:hypothetical protein
MKDGSNSLNNESDDEEDENSDGDSSEEIVDLHEYRLLESARGEVKRKAVVAYRACCGSFFEKCRRKVIRKYGIRGRYEQIFNDALEAENIRQSLHFDLVVQRIEGLFPAEEALVVKTAAALVIYCCKFMNHFIYGETAIPCLGVRELT